MQPDTLKDLVVDALEERKAVNIRVLDVSHLTTVTDWMVIASGTSKRHVRSLADNVLERTRERGVRPLGVEGEAQAEWILVDLADVVVHVMRPEVREFYNLENLWQAPAEVAARAGGEGRSGEA
ncbi:MAG TPA: ribosome silencing factor [Gammaproteobacteria bacterium]|nr:ribosome silencing factor [Gammaproteobacteria bacterium]